MNLCFQQGLSRKIIKEDLFVKENYRIPSRKQREKILEDYSRLSTEDRAKTLTWGAGQPMGPTGQPLLAMSVSHHLKDRIYVVYSSRFDPRAQN